MEKYCGILRDLREERGLTQAQIGNIIGVKQQQYGRYEKGVQRIPLKHFIALANFYDVTLDYITGYAPYNYSPEKLNEFVIPGYTNGKLLEDVHAMSESRRRDLVKYADMLKLIDKKR